MAPTSVAGFHATVILAGYSYPIAKLVGDERINDDASFDIHFTTTIKLAIIFKPPLGLTKAPLGVRKVRWRSVMGKGKSGGSRVIYYYHDSNMPIFLFTAFGKNDKANLSLSERNQLKRVIEMLVSAYGG